MKSKLHQKLQNKAMNYLLAKSYWVRAIEMPTSAGIIDVWGMSRSLDFATSAIEVKVSRNDFRSKSQKWKNHNARMIANTCYILCPYGLIRPDEVHPDWGLLWYREGQNIINKKQPKFNKMSDRKKLGTLIYFLSSGLNQPKQL